VSRIYRIRKKEDKRRRRGGEKKIREKEKKDTIKGDTKEGGQGTPREGKGRNERDKTNEEEGYKGDLTRKGK
jgi:hypothetical protein